MLYDLCSGERIIKHTKNHQRSIVLFNKRMVVCFNEYICICRDLGESPPLLYYNNMGCIHHYMNKPHLACFYLQKALQENELAMKSLPKAESGGATLVALLELLAC
jgi:CCR4-NOT transcription complex subunit 10